VARFFSKKRSRTPQRRRVDRKDKLSDLSDVFKRNRTLKLSEFHSIDGVDEKSDSVSSRMHVHRLTIHRRKILKIMLIALMSALCLWMIISNFTAKVTIGVPDTAISKTIDSSRYEQTIQKYFNSNPLSRFKFLLDQSALSDYVSSNLLEVDTVKQKDMVSLGQTNFVVTMRTPVAGWNINNKQYYVDSKGIAFDINYFLPPSVQIVDNRGISPQTGAAIVSNRFLSFVGRVVAAAKEKGYIVSQAILPPDTTRQLNINLKDSPISVKFSVDRSAGEQVEDMIQSLKYFESHGIVPGYIDVRVSGKAFYK
jgi:hypothetical protein